MLRGTRNGTGLCEKQAAETNLEQFGEGHEKRRRHDEQKRQQSDETLKWQKASWPIACRVGRVAI